MYLKDYPTEDLVQLAEDQGLLDATYKEIILILKERANDL